MDSPKSVIDQYSSRSVAVGNIVTPTTPGEVRNLLLEATAKGQHLYFVSGGRNWGYGSSLPIRQDSILVSLEKMNRILSFDSELGVLHIEAGVTQGQLERFLDENGFDYYVPNTGAGPEGTIIGNALERGFGIAPLENHAEGLLSAEGYLADGTFFQSALNEVNFRLGSCFPMGVGPSLDSLISQSSWVAVISAKVQLIKRTEACDLVILPFSESEWEKAVSLLQQINTRIDLPAGGFKILNQRQLQHTLANLPKTIRLLTPRADWTLAFFIRSSKRLRRSLHCEIAALISKLDFENGHSRWSLRKITRARCLIRLLPQKWRSRLETPLADLEELHRLGNGRTSMVGHKILKPDHGLLWLSPLCPLSPAEVAKLNQIVNRWFDLSADGTLIFQIATQTWTVLNQRTIALVLPLLFPLDRPASQIQDAYIQLLEELRRGGFSPYRFPADMMGYVTESIAPNHFSVIKRIETALDPHNVINAHRYHT